MHVHQDAPAPAFSLPIEIVPCRAYMEVILSSHATLLDWQHRPVCLTIAHASKIELQNLPNGSKSQESKYPIMMFARAPAE